MKKLLTLLLMLFFLPLFSFSQYTWEEVEFPDTIEIKMLAFDSTGILYIASNKGVYYSEDGEQWGQTNLPDYVSYIYINNNNTIYAGMNTLFRSFDLGATWDSIFFYPQGGINSLYTIGDSIICLGTWGGIFRSGDYGQTWEQPLSTYTAETVNCIAMNSQGTMFAGSTSYSGDLSPGGVYISDDYGETWVLIGLEYYFIKAMVIDSDDMIYVCARGNNTTGKLAVFKSVDNGLSWEIVYENNPVNTIAKNSYNEIAIGCDTQDGTQGGILLTTDRGDYWQDITTNLPTNSFRQVLFSQNNQLYTITYFDERQLFRTVIPVNVHEISNGNNFYHNFTTFPNPVKNKLTIQSSQFNNNTPFIITVYNMQGRKIFSKQAITSTGSYQLDVSGINPGMYIIELSSNEYKTSGKLVKK